MKKSFGTKLDRAIAKAYNDLYSVMDDIKANAKDIANNDFCGQKEYDDILNDIVKEVQQYMLLKKYIELLEDAEEEGA